MVDSRLEIEAYFEKSYSYGSLFILTKENSETRCVGEIKHINDGLGQISFVPLDEDGLPFEEQELLSFVNESGNISFKATVIKNHGTKWLTTEIPKTLRLINLRQHERITPNKKHILASPIITSYGEDGLKKNASFVGELLDISETGVSILVKARRLDGLFRSDIVELKLSERHSFLSQIRGEVVHKSIVQLTELERAYKIGVQFKKKQNIDPLMS
jgi:hypothetical protein